MNEHKKSIAISLYREGKSVAFIGRKIKDSWAETFKVLQEEFGEVKNSARAISTDKEQEIVDLYTRGMSLREIAKIYGVDKNVPGRIITRHKKMRNQIRDLKTLINGKRETSQGYFFVKTKDCGWRAEHRVVAESALGRKLLSDEVVHHIDGDIKNNRNDNLLICTKYYHSWLHAKIRSVRKQQLTQEALWNSYFYG